MRFLTLCIAVVWASVALGQAEEMDKAPPQAAPVTAKTTAKRGSEELNWYATAEFRHHINTYYDPDDYLGQREPSAHVRLQLGTTLYDGFLDAYATLGVFKVPQTQQVYQRRPQIALDVYPIRSSYFTVMQYNLIQLPFDEREQDLESDATDGDAGTIYTVGIAPSARYAFAAGGSRVTIKGGIDGWTKMYSRKQYVEDDESNEVDPRLGLDPLPEPDVPANEDQSEDYAQHYFTQATVVLRWDRLSNNQFETGLSGNYRSDYEPAYSEDGDYRYKPDRYSYYKWRLKYKLSDRVAILNDFYHFHEGLFAAKRRGDDNRRFRNIARIQCQL